MDAADRRPYFLWDEARDLDVWRFVRPPDVAAALDRLRPRLGRRYRFWRFLIDGWRSDGLLHQRASDGHVVRVSQFVVHD